MDGLKQDYAIAADVAIGREQTGYLAKNGWSAAAQSLDSLCNSAELVPELLAASEALLEKIGHVCGIESERRALIAAIAKAVQS